jgi:endonuclease/exonuclease/phosphatase family metal-dependent hydrolase
MRNGGSSPDAPAEDRGNAILSTLPLTALRAHELPLERQRRVAISATVRGTSRRGARFSMDWVNVHLDPRSARRRFHRSFGSGRARQIEWLLGTMAPETPALVGGDFNTWTRGARESAVRRLRSRFGVPTTANRGTLAVSRFLPSLRLDHVFWRLPHAWRSDCRILESTYGSDHRALVGRIRIDSATSQP